MCGRTIRNITIVALACLLGGLLPASAANQQDYCIKCSNPDETYICRITSISGEPQGKQFLCIMNIAKDHGHDSCSAAAQTNGCAGVLVQYETSGAAQPFIQRDAAARQDAPTDIETPENQNAEPKTLVEFTKQATKATQNSLNNAGSNTKKALNNTGKAIKSTGNNIKDFTSKVGSNITTATKTTWKCLTSLFSNCSNK